MSRLSGSLRIGRDIGIGMRFDPVGMRFPLKHCTASSAQPVVPVPFGHWGIGIRPTDLRAAKKAR